VIGDQLPAQSTINVTNGGELSLTDLSVATTYAPGQPTNWLTVSSSGAVAPMTITVRPNTTSLAKGTYTATITISSPAATNSPRTVTVTYTLNRPPSILLGGTTATFSAQATTALPAAQTISVTNGGDGSLTGLAVGSISYSSKASGWLTATISPDVAPATLTLRPNTTMLAVGQDTAIVAVTSTQPGIAAVFVTVIYNVTDAPTPPMIVLSATSLAFNGVRGDASPPVQQTINVTNGGQVDLTNVSVTTSYAAGQPTNWLDVTPSGTAAPIAIAVRPNTTGLTAGTYTATITVSAAAATNSPRTVTVTYTLIRPPSIVLASTTANFNATQNAATPGQQSISITNGGDVALTGLSVGTITYSAGATNWLSASVSQPNAPSSLLLQPNTTALAPGTYTATVPVISGVATNSPQPVTVTYQVAAPPPILVVDPTSLTFTTGRNFASLPAAQTIAVTSTGGTASGLSVSVTYSGASGWLGTPTFVGSVTATPTTLTVRPTTNALTAGVYSAVIHISSSTAGVVTKDVPVTYVVNDLVLDRTSVAFTTSSSALPLSQVVNVSNGGSGPINGVSVSVGSYTGRADGTYQWLQASIANQVPQTPAATSLTLNVTRADSLSDFSAVVTISGSGVVSKTVTVTYHRQATMVDILPILQSSTCGSCHTTRRPGRQAAGGNLNIGFGSLDDAYNSLVAAPNNTHTYVLPPPADSTAMNLYKVLNGTPPVDYTAMPFGCAPATPGNCLTAGLRTRIYIWMMQGAQKN
jgi:hypothetical protein